MYNIEFYTNRNGQSEILNFLEALRTKVKPAKMHAFNTTRLFSISICLQRTAAIFPLRSRSI